MAIACQGGGSHTGFTAGVLKRLLHSELEITGLSGTSGGAICAYLAWSGLVLDDPALGAELLDRFWSDIAATDPAERVVNAAAVAAARAQALLTPPEAMPYLYPFWGGERLRSALERNVDFEAVSARGRESGAPLLLVGAVEVLTGEFRLFRDADVDIDAVLASCAVPELFDAVRTRDGVFWDGLLSQNPPVRQLAWSLPDEIWIIQINPRRRTTEPRTPAEIRDRRNELAANLSLEQEVWFVRRINELIERGVLVDPDHKVIELRRIELGEGLDAVSKLDRSSALINDLMARGEAAAEEFLASLRPR